jgi:hypothetical protein
MAAMKRALSPLETALDTLYASPLEGFVARRAELMKALQGEAPGDAAALGKARRPALTAWAINQAVRADAAAKDELLKAGAELKASQAALLRGGDAASFRTSSERLHAAVRRMTDASGRASEAGGHPLPASALGRIERTLFTGATGTGEEMALLEHGLLTADLSAADALEHGGLTGPLPPAPPPPPRARPKAADTVRREAAARRSAEKDAKRLEAAARLAERQARSAAQQADTLEAQARNAETHAKTWSERAHDARWQATQARAKAVAAEEAARSASQEAAVARSRTQP